MIRKIHIENFRSIRNENLDLGKITVLTGANNSGKSSILYGLMVLQDFVFNPNQSLEELFALPFINLGGFEEVKSKNYTHSPETGFIRIGVSVDSGQIGKGRTKYHIALGKNRTFLDLSAYDDDIEINASMNIGLPYTATKYDHFKAFKKREKAEILFDWNGFQATVHSNLKFTPQEHNKIVETIQKPIYALVDTNFIPVVRGFTKPFYNLVPMTGMIYSEDEIATMLKTEKKVDILSVVNNFLEKIAERVIELPSNGTPGLFSVKVKNTKTGQSNFLVNEGSGTNQLVTILAKIFQFNKSFTCIDEPEIHLHPSMVRKLANAFVDISTDMGEHQFLVSTHSEHFVQALLANVAQGKIKPDDVKIYHLTMTENGTKIEPQTVNEKGQVEGGLSHFYEAELSDLKSMFKLVD